MQYEMMTSTLSRLSPALGEQALALLEVRKASCLASLEDVFAAQTAAKAVLDDASSAEEEALMAVCAYRCASIEEAALKAGYLHAELEPQHIEALLGSFLP